MKKMIRATRINCQLLNPKNSNRSEYVNCPISIQLLININILSQYQPSNENLPYLNNIINTRFKQEIVISMKQQSMPQIPQQNHAQTHSMYQQLRNTSERLSSNSHRRIFGNSNYTKSKQSENYSSKLFDRSRSKREQMELPEDSNEKMRIILLMKEQIEISCQQYTNRMKIVFQDQAKKIKLLGDLLLKNQMQLNKKEKIILGLVNFIQNQAKRPNSEKYEELVHSLQQKQDNISALTNKIDELRKGQNNLISKISLIDKGYNKRLQQFTNNLNDRFNNYYDECEERLDKFEKVLQMNSNDKKITKRGSINQNTTFNSIIKNMSSFSNEIEEFRQQITAFKAKKYKYDNYKLEQVQNLIKKIVNTQNSLQNPLIQRQVSLGALKSSSTTKFSRTDSHFQTKYSQTSKTRFLNKYKSLINHRFQKKPSRESQSESQSEVQQTLMQQQTNIERLRKIICEMGLRIPLKLEIDQTGYAKSVDTGMYLVDSQGNGFEFSKGELQFLTQNNTIELQY